jgi:hypothetical protein
MGTECGFALLHLNRCTLEFCSYIFEALACPLLITSVRASDYIMMIGHFKSVCNSG